MARIVIDAGHGGDRDPGAVYGDRQEKNDNLALALAVGQILQDNGVEVIFTRTEDIYQSPLEKAQLSNAQNPDFLISFHRNSSPEPNQYTGVETLVFRNEGEKAALAGEINRRLEDVGFQNLGVRERPGLVILRRSRDPALLVETGFINSDADNALFDRQFENIAQAIASAILEEVNAGPEPEGRFYRVQTGAFRNLEYAQDMVYQLQQQGYPAILQSGDGFYRVQVGAFRSLDNAIKMEAELRGRGYSTYLVYL